MEPEQETRACWTLSCFSTLERICSRLCLDENVTNCSGLLVAVSKTRLANSRGANTLYSTSHAQRSLYRAPSNDRAPLERPTLLSLPVLRP